MVELEPRIHPPASRGRLGAREARRIQECDEGHCRSDEGQGTKTTNTTSVMPTAVLSDAIDFAEP